jgi:hypothetical protein
VNVVIERSMSGNYGKITALSKEGAELLKFRAS